MENMATMAQVDFVERMAWNMGRLEMNVGEVSASFQYMAISMGRAFSGTSVSMMNRSLDNTNTEVEQISSGLAEAAAQQRALNQSINDGEKSAGGLGGKFSEAFTNYAKQGVSQLVQLSDDMARATAKFNLISESPEAADQMTQNVLAAAKRSRTSFTDTANTVTDLSTTAPETFSNSNETIQFAENLNKSFVVAGFSPEEISAASAQVTDAMAIDTMSADQLNVVFGNTPNILTAIADYMGVPIDQLRIMADQGQITAGVIKNAMLSATDQINGDLESTPMTWSQVWTGVTNELMTVAQPLLGFIGILADNWSILEPIIWGVVAALIAYNATSGMTWLTTLKQIGAKVWHASVSAAETAAIIAMEFAQHGLNAALSLCPLTWIIILIIVLIALFYAIIAAINKFAGTSISATGIIVGALAVAAAFIGNLFVTLINFIIDIFVVLWNFIGSFANFFANVFTDPIGAVARLFFDLVDTVLSVLETIASAIDTIFGSDLAESVSGWRDGLGGWVDKTFGKGEEVMKTLDANALHLNRFEYSTAWDAGYNWGSKLGSKKGKDWKNLGQDQANEGYSSSFASSVPSDVSAISANTGKMADSMDISAEELKYLRDLAEQEAINRFTTAEIKVEMTNHNRINSDMDIDGIVDKFAVGLNEAMGKAAEGVHS